MGTSRWWPVWDAPGYREKRENGDDEDALKRELGELLRGEWQARQGP